jgi:hypothetical protein
VGVDAWTRTPFERDKQAKEARAKTARRPSESLGQKAKSRWSGEHRKCQCGCGRTANAFRDGKMYASKCVGRGSGWDKSGLPQDRTPPQSWRRRRELNRSSRDLDGSTEQ